jgi:hypothetical protein
MGGGRAGAVAVGDVAVATPDHDGEAESGASVATEADGAAFTASTLVGGRA